MSFLQVQDLAKKYPGSTVFQGVNVLAEPGRLNVGTIGQPHGLDGQALAERPDIVERRDLADGTLVPRHQRIHGNRIAQYEDQHRQEKHGRHDSQPERVAQCRPGRPQRL